MAKDYHNSAEQMRDKLNNVSSSFCLAKWLQVSLHLPQGLTQSCYHPPTHTIPLSELKRNPSALHNTNFKKQERKLMLKNERPEGCSYCWKMEDNNHLSDRHYRSSEWWAEPNFDEVVARGATDNITPRYVEVNFNQACNFKCMYCSPHLSSTWEEDIEKHGAFKLGDKEHNNLDYLRKSGMMPLKLAQAENPYVEAFWKWWPFIYRDLRVFRMTGGEPLMDKNTFKVLEYVNENPHGLLELSITSNMCPPDDKLFEKFVGCVQDLEEIRTYEDLSNFNENSGNSWYVAPALKHFMLFISLDSVGNQAEYIRTGLDYEKLLNNTRTFLRSTKFTSVTFINTFNILSIPNLDKFLELMLELRKEFGGRMQEDFTMEIPGHPPYVHKKFKRVWFDVPVLRYPNWFSIQNIGQYGIDVVERCISFMEQNCNQTEFEGFEQYEILKLQRDLSLMKQELGADELKTNKADFIDFIDELDKRRSTSFKETFPQMAFYYDDCKLNGR